MDATAIAANERFYALVASLPKRPVVVGEYANGAPVVAEVHSLFGGAE